MYISLSVYVCMSVRNCERHAQNIHNTYTWLTIVNMYSILKWLSIIIPFIFTGTLNIAAICADNACVLFITAGKI